MGKPWPVPEELEGLDLEAIVPNVPNVPEVSLPYFDDERHVLDLEEWDDLETAAWLTQPSWASIREDDPLDPYG